MKVPLNQLTACLQKGLAPIFLIAGDDILQVNEATDAVRAAARGAGFDERELKTADRSFRWDSIGSGAESLSLFASRRVLELRMPTPKPGDAGAKAIRALAEEPDPDRLVILSISARIDQRVARSVWVKAIEEHGVVVEIRPIGREALPRWIASRAREEGLRFSTDAAELLADRAEGNLLAADQEIKKLALIGGDREITAADVAESVAEGARYDVFRLSDALVSGNLVRALTVLSGLEAEGSAPPLVVWAIVKELTLLAQIKQAELAGDDVDAALARLRVWPSRRTTLKRAARQLSWSRVRALLEQAETVDRGVKGAATVPPWQLIRQLTLDTIRSLKRVHA